MPHNHIFLPQAREKLINLLDRHEPNARNLEDGDIWHKVFDVYTKAIGQHLTLHICCKSTKNDLVQNIPLIFDEIETLNIPTPEDPDNPFILM